MARGVKVEVILMVTVRFRAENRPERSAGCLVQTFQQFAVGAFLPPIQNRDRLAIGQSDARDVDCATFTMFG